MIDYSNGYPVQVTTNVTKDTPWREVFRQNESLKKTFLDWSTDNWRPSNWENIQKYPHSEDDKNVFLKLRYHGHIPINGEAYYKALDRYYKLMFSGTKEGKELKIKVEKYIEMTEQLKYKPTNKFKFKFLVIPIVERTYFGKEYYKLENELITLFSKI